jgi:DNA-binding transcriptional LysR family regulator
MQIRALEEELGTPLFLRTSRRVELTEAGELLRVEAERTIAQAQRAKSIVQRAARGEIGSVRIAFIGNAAFAGKLSADVRRFHERYPAVELELRELPAALHAEALLQDQFDVAYYPVLGGEVDPRLTADRIGSWRFHIAMRHDHPFAAKTSLSPPMLVDEGFLVFASHPADRGQLPILRQLLGCEPKITHHVSNTLTMLALAAAGLGLALVPASLVDVHIQNIQYRPLDGFELAAELNLLSRVDETAGAVKAYVEIARSQAP